MPQTNPQITNFLQKQIRNQLGDSSIQVKELQVSTGYYVFTYGGGIEYLRDEETGHQIGIIPIKVTDDIKYWLALTLAYNNSLKIVDSISFSIFSDSPYQKLFRAEWANNKSLSSHAQPHWHVHSEQTNLNPRQWLEDDTFIFQAIEDNKESKIKNLHFAMAAEWHKNETHIQVLSSNDDKAILKWSKGVLHYISNQLKYIHDKRLV